MQTTAAQQTATAVLILHAFVSPHSWQSGYDRVRARRPHTVIPFVLGSSLGTTASSSSSSHGVCLVRAGSELRGEGKLEAVISDGVRGFRGT